MGAETPVHPSADSWVAAIHSSEDDFAPLGTAVVVDPVRLVTCAHVVVAENGTIREPLWVAFPKAGDCPRRRVGSFALAHSPPVRDLAVLVLDEPVPSSVEAAPLRCPRPGDLTSRSWWAFGFPDFDPVGNSADGSIGSALGYGWVRLDTASRYLVQAGFSGGGLWSRDYHAVVGIVGQAHANGDGRAITLHQADLLFPDQKLAELASWSVETAGEVALQQWGWTLKRDPEGVRHWRPRARGVSIESERGYRFSGRAAALNQIVAWLDRADPDRSVLVVTGSPGVGKSAVLGRIVTTADADIRSCLPASDNAVRASLGSVSCAVHAKAKTALEVAEEIARAASAKIPLDTADLAPAIQEALRDRGSARFNVIIDALDEAASPFQARRVIEGVVLPLVETCSDAGAQVVVGTRRRDDDGDLLAWFGDARVTIDLDSPEFFAEADLVGYAKASLQLAGAERRDNPYADDVVATAFACKIADMSAQNFLVAGLVARSHGLHDIEAVDMTQVSFPNTVETALAAYLQRLRPLDGVPASRVMTALAFAEAPGLPARLWQLALEAVDKVHVDLEDLAWFARSSAANFLVETGAELTLAGRGGRTTYRLFHQALNDALLSSRADVMHRVDDEKALTLAFIAEGRRSNWEDSPGYLFRSLPRHASAVGLVDELLGDDAYLLRADLQRLMQAAHNATVAHTDRTRLLQLTPQAITASPAGRAALFSVTEAMDNLGASYRSGDWEAPYRALWASVTPRVERAVLTGHMRDVRAVCAVRVDDRELLASASDDRTVRIWDPQTGEQRAILEGHLRAVRAICSFDLDGGQLLASGGDDRTVRIWDPRTGQQRMVLEGHAREVRALCPITSYGRQLVASGGGDRTVRVWDPQTGEQICLFTGHDERVRAVCPVAFQGHHLLASAGDEREVQIWDPRTGELRHRVVASIGAIYAMCSMKVDEKELLAFAHYYDRIDLWDPSADQEHNRFDVRRGGIWAVCAAHRDATPLLVSGGADRMVRVWDPRSGEQIRALEGHHDAVYGVCSITVDDQELIASASADRTIRIWDPQNNCVPGDRKGHADEVRGLCAITVDGQELIASASADRTIRIWNPATGDERTTLEGHQDQVNSVCAITVDGQELLASASADRTIRIWNPATGDERTTLEGHLRGIRAVCPIAVSGDHLLVSSGNDRTIRIWDPRTGLQQKVLEGHENWVRALCPITLDGQQLLASGGDDNSIRIWDPGTGQLQKVFEGHQDWVRALCPITLDGQQLLASGGDDMTIRIWNPRSGACLVTVPAYYPALALAPLAESIAIGLAAGILLVKLDPGIR